MALYWYFIRNERLGQSVDMAAQSAEAACQDLCWAITDCVVIRVGQVFRHPAEREQAEPEEVRAKARRKA